LRPEVVYLDSSALVKIVVLEKESEALRAFVAESPARVTSAVSVTEVRRAIGRLPGGHAQADRARLVLDGVALLAVDLGILDRAAGVAPQELRTLDAIHIASALSLGADLLAFVTYDERQRVAARKAGLPVAAPGA